MSGAPTEVPARRRGSALLSTLIVTALLGTLVAALVLVVMSESLTSANHAAAQQALYAADAALEATISELQAADWPSLPGGFVSGRLRDGSADPRSPDGTRLDLARLMTLRQAESDARFGALPDRPVWRLAGRAPLRDLLPGLVVPTAYLLIWVADDPDERDADPQRDSNLIVLIRAEAFGPSGAHRSLEATLSLQVATPPVEDPDAPPPPERRHVRMLAWREARGTM